MLYRIILSLILLVTTSSIVSAQREGVADKLQESLLASPSTPLPDADSPYFTLIGEADEAIAAQRWTDAVMALKAAMRVEPGNPTNILLMSNLGMVYFYAGQDSLALDVLNSAHNMAPVSVTVLLNRARVLAVTGREEEAYDDYGLVTRLDTTLSEPLYLHGMIALRTGRTDVAETDFRRLERLAPDESTTLMALSALYRNTMRFAEALPYLDRLIATDSTSYNFGARAVCRLFTDDLNGASTDIAEGLRLDPDDGELYLYRSLLNRARYRFDDARDDARRAIELGVSPSRIPPMN